MKDFVYIFCQKFGFYDVEDEYHFLFSCTLYANLRSTILGNITPNHQNFIRIMTTDNEQIINKISNFVYCALKLRKESLSSVKKETSRVFWKLWYINMYCVFQIVKWHMTKYIVLWYCRPMAMNTWNKLIIIINKKMQHICWVTYSIALSYQFQNTTILVNLLNIILYEFIESRVYWHTIKL